MRTVQSILDFFLETPQAYFCDRCGECHRAGECKEEKTAPREPKEGTLPRKPGEKRKSRIHKKKEKKRRKVKGSSRSLWARRGRDRVRQPGLKTGISGMMRTRLDEEGLSPPPNPRALGRASRVMRWGLDLDLPLISPADADPAAVPRRRVRSDG
jgi:hypothetical protein